VTVAAYEIRTADLDDLDAVQDVFRRASLSNEADRELILANLAMLDYDEVHVRAGRTRVAVAGGRIVGFATLLFDEGAELEDLFVDPDWMRHGVGTALIDDAAAIARTHGATRIEVTGNDHARAFYDAVGFVAVGMVATPLGPLAHRMYLDVAKRA
jgi:GNAT superfamily N-acetyltransferase